MDRSVWLERVVVVGALLITVVGVGSFGIWDPWELTPALGADWAFAIFGVSETSARMPVVLGGLSTGALTFCLVRAEAGGRAAVIAVAVLASTPLFLLSSRLTMGGAIGMAAQAWVGAAALAASAEQRRGWNAALCYTGLTVGIGASTFISGVLLGPLPPLLAVSAWILISEGHGANAWSRWALPLGTFLALVGVVRAVVRDAPEVSRWLGGGAVGGNPPTWDAALELVFHGFAPWSAALPVAAAWAMWPREGRSARAQRLVSVLVLWLGFGFASWTVFASRYGTPPWLATLPLAGLVGLWLAEVSEAQKPGWAAATTIVLLTGLLVRDYALYPDSALRALATDTLSVPDVYEPAPQWAVTFSLAGLTLALVLVSPGGTEKPNPRATVRWLRARWHEQGPPRGWMLLAMSLLGACVVFGLMCFALDLRIASVVVRAGRYALFAPLVLAALVFGLPWAQHLFNRLGALRIFAVLAMGLAVGAFTAWWFQPALGQHFSPKLVFESYATLEKGPDEPLASYRAPTSAASYYTDTPIEEIEDQGALLRFLRAGGQRWAVLPADALGKVDRAYRRETGKHLYVADARSARLLLIAAEPIEGIPNQSFIADAVRERDPSVQYLVNASFGDRVELVGFDLDLPSGDTVGAGQRFRVTWYWRALENPPSGYKVFVHIDGNGLRLNGDHDPVDGRYPPKLWEREDVIADSQELTVPANFRTGEYVMYVGWFSGSNRLKVESGPNDGVDRVRAGVLHVR